MIATAISALRLIWPFVKELFSSMENDPVKRRNRELNVMFILLMSFCVLSISLIDFGMNNHKFYTAKISDAAVNLEKAKQVNRLAEAVRQENLGLRKANKKNLEEIGLLNRLLSRALDSLPLTEAENILNREMAWARTDDDKVSIKDRLDELVKQYPSDKPK